MSAALVSRIMDVEVPRPLSKSQMKALGCPTHYAHYYLTKDSPLRQVRSALAQAGTDFHNYRQAYVEHLINLGANQDSAFALAWLQENAVCEDARTQILLDAPRWKIRVDQVYGAEVFLSVDRRLVALECEPGKGGAGRLSKHPEAQYCGSIDLIELDGQVCRVHDFKTGWSTSSVSDDEPPLYAALAFAHFPQVELVQFVWEFTRVGQFKLIEYRREDLSWILPKLEAAQALKRELAIAFAAGEDLDVDPTAGMCPYCEIACPLRREVVAGDVMLPPLQTREDAERAAKLLYVGELLVAAARQRLNAYLDEHGPLQFGRNFVAEVAVSASSSYPLLETLAVLGIELAGPDGKRPTKSPEFDVPLDKLTIGASALNSYAKAKARRGLKDLLQAYAVQTPKSSVKVRRLGEQEDDDNA